MKVKKLRKKQNGVKSKRIFKIPIQKTENIPPRDQNQWVMRKLNPTASSARVDGNTIKMGFPKVYTKIYPGQTMRLNTGWNIDALPSNSILTTVPSQSLANAGLLAIPRSVHSQNSGSELVQQIQNNSPYPIQIQLPNSQNEEPKLVRLLPNNLSEELQIQFGDILHGILGVASAVCPILSAL